MTEKRLDRNDYQRDYQEWMADLLPVLAVLLVGLGVALFVIASKI